MVPADELERTGVDRQVMFAGARWSVGAASVSARSTPQAHLAVHAIFSFSRISYGLDYYQFVVTKVVSRVGAHAVGCI